MNVTYTDFILVDEPVSRDEGCAVVCSMIVSIRRLWESYALSPLALAVPAVFIHYWLTRIWFFEGKRTHGKFKSPPLVPQVLPILGNIPWGLLHHPRLWVQSSRKLFWSGVPVRERWFFMDFYVVQGAANIVDLLKNPRLSITSTQTILLRFLFLLPAKAADTRFADDSGEYAKPLAGSTTAPHNRVIFFTQNCIRRFLTGRGFAPFMANYQNNLTSRLRELPIGTEWSQSSDFAGTFRSVVMSAVLDTLCGPAFRQRHPQFLQDFWTMDDNVHTLLMKTPWIFARRANTGRNRALQAVKEWSKWAQENFDPMSVDADGSDPYWGTKFFRERTALLTQVDGYDEDAVAAEDLLFIWAANSNAVKAAYWCALDIFKRPELLARVRQEAEACLIEYSSHAIRFDVDRLLQQPVLQAVFAETTRLRIHGIFTRRLDKCAVDVNGWRIPRGKWIITSSTPANMDPDAWASGPDADHPVDEFWPGRFLRPVRSGDDQHSSSQEFTTAGKDGYYVSFGGGKHACPGKQFAKQQNLFFLASMVMMFDCEVFPSEKSIQMSTRNYGCGMLAPAGKIPYRVRRRHLNSGELESLELPSEASSSTQTGSW